MRREISVTTAGPNARLGILIVLVAAAFALTSAPADASYIHPEPGYEFGPTGLSTSSFPGSVAEMDFDQSSKRIFLLVKNDNKIYSMHFAGAGSFAPSGLPFPLTVPSSALLHRRRDRQHRGRDRRKPLLLARRRSDPRIHARRRGACRPSPRKPARSAASGSTTKAISGPATSTHKTMEEFEPTGGAPIKTVDVSGTGSPCRVRFDLSNNDMFVPQYGGQGAVRYTAASGYAPGSAQVFDPTTNANGRDQRDPARRLHSRLQQGLGIRHRDRVAARDLRGRRRLLHQRSRGRRRDRHGLPLERLHRTGSRNGRAPSSPTRSPANRPATRQVSGSVGAGRRR